jgi:putative endonuclease
VFVEVKTRSDADHTDPQDAVNRPKQERIGRCAQYFLRQTDSLDRACRFDVVAIVRMPDGSSRIEHFIEAYVPSH